MEEIPEMDAVELRMLDLYYGIRGLTSLVSGCSRDDSETGLHTQDLIGLARLLNHLTKEAESLYSYIVDWGHFDKQEVKE